MRESGNAVRRILLISVALVLAGGVLAACGSDDDGTSAPMDEHMDDGMDDHMSDGHGEASPVVEGAREIAVTADSFTFEPDEITVAAGEDVAIALTSVDILHDFTVDELDVHVAAARGATETGGLRADEPGRYEFYCTVAGHREAGMEGTLVVED